jgi:hypothetical protein
MEDILSKYIVKKSKVTYDFDNCDVNSNEFCKNSLIKTKSIKEYYDNSSVFITGKSINFKKPITLKNSSSTDNTIILISNNITLKFVLIYKKQTILFRVI